MNSGLIFWFLGNLQNSLFLLQSENFSVYWKNSDLSSDQKRSQIDRANAVSNFIWFQVIMFLVVAISLLLAAVVLISLVLLERHHSADPVRKVPGPKTNLLFGNVLQLPRLPNGE